MEALASPLFPMLPGQALPTALPGEDFQTLTGAEFLQTLVALGASSAPGQAEAALLQGLTGTLEAPPGAPIEEMEEGVDAALALQWLPLTHFIESAIAQKAPPAAAVTGEGAAEGALLTAVAAGVAAGVATAPATATGKKSLPGADPAAKASVETLPAGSESAYSAEPSDFATELAATDAAENLAVIVDKPATVLSAGANTLNVAASVASALQAGNSRSQVDGSMGAAQNLQGPIRTPVHSARWAQEIGQRITLMAAAGQQNGTLTLTPENMGPLEVRIHVSQDTANVWFGAQQADTRAALVDALPRLREMFAANGLSLGEANVSHEAPRDREAARAFGAGPNDSEEAGSRDLSRPLQRLSLGMIDTYA